MLRVRMPSVTHNAAGYYHLRGHAHHCHHRQAQHHATHPRRATNAAGELVLLATTTIAVLRKLTSVVVVNILRR